MATPQENFSGWLKEHYELVWDDDSPVARCRRCGMRVSYVTKHAVVRHGDDIEVMPAAKGQQDLAEAY